jgi:hypothetical protein
LTIFYHYETLLRGLAFVSHLISRKDAAGKSVLDYAGVHFRHKSVRHFFVQWLLEIFIWVKLDSQILLDAARRLNALESALIELLRDLSDLTDLGLEASILSLLAFVRFNNHIVQDGNLFLKIALNVVALGFCDIFNGVLLAFELTDFFASVCYFLFEHHDFFLNTIYGGFEAEGLLGSERGIRLAHDGSTGHANLAHFLVLLLKVGATHTYRRYQ